MLGRWSEPVVRMRHSESKAIWEEAIVRSGNVRSLGERMRIGLKRIEVEEKEVFFRAHLEPFAKIL